MIIFNYGPLHYKIILGDTSTVMTVTVNTTTTTKKQQHSIDLHTHEEINTTVLCPNSIIITQFSSLHCHIPYIIFCGKMALKY